MLLNPGYCVNKKDKCPVVKTNLNRDPEISSANLFKYETCCTLDVLPQIRYMRGAPRNPAPRNHSLAWIVKPSDAATAQMHLVGKMS